MKSFKVSTENNALQINCFSGFIPKSGIQVNKNIFAEMCMKGCKNYNQKYSCPPFVPEFNSSIKDYDGLFIIMLSSNLENIKSTEYNKIRIANVIMKSRIKKLMYYLESKFNSRFFSTGSCELCKPCKCKLNQPCSHPEKRRHSLEAAGVDCNKLAKDLFDLELLWYKDNKSPKYSSVICGLPCNLSDIKNIEKELEDYKFN